MDMRGRGKNKQERWLNCMSMQEQLSGRNKIHIKDFHLKFFMEVRQADAPKIMHSVAYGMILLNKAKRMLVNNLILFILLYNIL